MIRVGIGAPDTPGLARAAGGKGAATAVVDEAGGGHGDVAVRRRKDAAGGDGQHARRTDEDIAGGGGGEVAVQRDVAAIDRDRTSDGKIAPDGHGRGVARLAERKGASGGRDGELVSGEGGPEARALRLDRDGAGAEEADVIRTDPEDVTAEGRRTRLRSLTEGESGGRCLESDRLGGTARTIRAVQQHSAADGANDGATHRGDAVVVGTDPRAAGDADEGEIPRPGGQRTRLTDADVGPADGAAARAFDEQRAGAAGDHADAGGDRDAMLAPGGVVTAAPAQGDRTVGSGGRGEIGADRQAGEVAGELGPRVGVQEQVAGRRDGGVDGDVAAIDRDRTGDGDGGAERDGRSVGRFADGQTREGRSIGVAGDGGREGRAGGLDRDRARAGEAGRRRRGIASEDDTSARDGGGAGIGAGAGERERVGAGLGERARAADGVGEGQRVGTIEDQRAVVDDRSADDAGGAPCPDLQRTGADRRGAGEGVGAGQGQLEHPEFGETEAVAPVGNDAGQREVSAVGAPGRDTAVTCESDITGEGDGSGRAPRSRVHDALLRTVGFLPAQPGAELQGVRERTGAVEIELPAGKDADEGCAGAEIRQRLRVKARLIEHHDGGSRKRICSGQLEETDAVTARAAEFQRAISRDGMRDRERRGVGTEVTQRRAGGDAGSRRSRQRPGRAAVAHLQDAGRDGGRTRIGVGRGQGRGASARLRDGAQAADDVREGLVRRGGDLQRAVVRDGIGIGAAAERAPTADPQRAARDARGAGVGIRAGQHHRARAAGGGIEDQSGLAAVRGQIQGARNGQRLARGDIEDGPASLVHRAELGAERRVFGDGDRAVQVIDAPDRGGRAGAGGELAARQGDQAEMEGLSGGAVGRQFAAGPDRQRGGRAGTDEGIRSAGQRDRAAALDVDTGGQTQAGVPIVGPAGHRHGLGDLDRAGGAEIAAEGHRARAAEEEAAGAAERVARGVGDVAAGDRSAEGLVGRAGEIEGRARGDGERADIRAGGERACAADAERTGVDREVSGEGVDAVQDGQAGAGLGQTEGRAADDAAQAELRAPDVEGARSAERDGAAQAARAGRSRQRAAVERQGLGTDEGVPQVERGAARHGRTRGGGPETGGGGDGQRAGGDRGRSGVGVSALEDGRARTRLLKRTGAGDDRAHGQRAGAVEDQRSVVRDRAGAERAGRAARADADRAARDGRRAIESVRAGEDECPAGGVGRQITRTRERAAERRAQGRQGQRGRARRREAMDIITGGRPRARGGRTTRAGSAAEVAKDDRAGAARAAVGGAAPAGAHATPAAGTGVSRAGNTSGRISATGTADARAARAAQGAAPAATAAVEQGSARDRAGQAEAPGAAGRPGEIPADTAGAAAATGRCVRGSPVGVASGIPLPGGAGRARLPGDRVADRAAAAGCTGGRSSVEILATTAAAQGRHAPESRRATGTTDAGVGGTRRAAGADGKRIGGEVEIGAAGKDTPGAATAAAMTGGLTAAAATTAADDQIVDRLIEIDGGRAGEGDGVGDRGDRASDQQVGPADGQRPGTERGIMIGADGPARDGRAAGIGVRTGQRDDAARGGHGTGAADDARDDDEVRPAEIEDPVVRDGAGAEGAGGGAVADAQRAGGDGRDAGVTVRAGESEDVGAELGHGARTRDRPGEDQRVGAIKDEGGAVDHVAGQGPGRGAVADPQGARGHRGAARVRGRAGEDHRARARLLDGARAGKVAGDRQRAGAVEDQGSVVRDRTGAERAGRAARPDADRPARDDRRADIRIRAGEDQRAARGGGGEVARAGDRAAQRRAQGRQGQRGRAGRREGMQGISRRQVGARRDRAARAGRWTKVTRHDDAGTARAAHAAGIAVGVGLPAAPATTRISRARAAVEARGGTAVDAAAGHSADAQGSEIRGAAPAAADTAGAAVHAGRVSGTPAAAGIPAELSGDGARKAGAAGASGSERGAARSARAATAAG